MEVGTYAELRGAAKEKEGFMQMVRGLRKLRNLGYVNFGEPLSLVNHLNKQCRSGATRLTLSISAPGVDDAGRKRHRCASDGAHQRSRCGERHEPVRHRAAGIAPALADT